MESPQPAARPEAASTPRGLDTLTTVIMSPGNNKTPRPALTLLDIPKMASIHFMQRVTHETNPQCARSVNITGSLHERTEVLGHGCETSNTDGNTVLYMAVTTPSSHQKLSFPCCQNTVTILVNQTLLEQPVAYQYRRRNLKKTNVGVWSKRKINLTQVTVSVRAREDTFKTKLRRIPGYPWILSMSEL